MLPLLGPGSRLPPELSTLPCGGRAQIASSCSTFQKGARRDVAPARLSAAIPHR
jgi:hypothetical protein